MKLDDENEYVEKEINTKSTNTGINLAPNDEWKYEDYVGSNAETTQWIAGWTPRNKTNIYFDRNGEQRSASDNSVIITSYAFELGEEAVIYTMSHEAVHSWIEYLIETKATKEPKIGLSMSFAIAGEEVIVDSILKNSSNLTVDQRAWANKHLVDVDLPKYFYNSNESNEALQHALQQFEELYGFTLDIFEVERMVFEK